MLSTLLSARARPREGARRRPGSKLPAHDQCMPLVLPQQQFSLHVHAPNGASKHCERE